MYYVSTRDASLRYTAAQAIVQGLSREGGLFLPSEIPQLSREDLTELTRCSYPERAAHIMGLYLDDFSQEELLGFAEKAYGPAKFDTPAAAPVVKTEDGAYVMELWHGPTCAVSYTHLRAHETAANLVCRLLLDIAERLSLIHI